MYTCTTMKQGFLMYPHFILRPRASLCTPGIKSGFTSGLEQQPLQLVGYVGLPNVHLHNNETRLPDVPLFHFKVQGFLMYPWYKVGETFGESPVLGLTSHRVTDGVSSDMDLIMDTCHCSLLIHHYITHSKRVFLKYFCWWSKHFKFEIYLENFVGLTLVSI